jgi:hypothetical protein
MSVLSLQVFAAANGAFAAAMVAAKVIDPKPEIYHKVTKK